IIAIISDTSLDNINSDSDNNSSDSDNNSSDSDSTSQIRTSEEIDYSSPEDKGPPKSLLKWYNYLSDEYKDRIKSKNLELIVLSSDSSDYSKGVPEKRPSIQGLLDCFLLESFGKLSKGNFLMAWWLEFDVRMYLTGGAIEVAKRKEYYAIQLELENSRKRSRMIAGVARMRVLFRMVKLVEKLLFSWTEERWTNFKPIPRSPKGVRVAREDDRGVIEGREDVREVFQQRRSGAKRKPI
ncbi:hypothetical protein Tco_0683826, partial [Tanacetum coccineum]